MLYKNTINIINISLTIYGFVSYIIHMDNFITYKIDIKNLICNIKNIKRKIGNGCDFCAVVKADCYGLGMENIIPYIDDYVDCYGVATIAECKKLRMYSNKKILLLSEVFLDDLMYCSECGVSVSISSLNTLKMIEGHLKDSKINVHFKINSGMNRYGIRSEIEFKKCLNFINRSNVLNLEGVFTHFASNENNIEFLLNQRDFFEKMIANLQKNDIKIHSSSSSAAITLGLKYGNMVRIGFGMYGEFNNDISLKKVLSISAKVLSITYVKKGEKVGYDQTYVAKENMKLAVVGMGYADGFSRRLSNNFSVLINGRHANVIGNVCMDCFMLDVTHIKNVYLGSEVVVLGKDGANEICLNDYAEVLNTNPYEVLLSFRRNRSEVVVKN